MLIRGIKYSVKQIPLLTIIVSSSYPQINSKYSDELAQECLEWIKEITAEDISTSGDMENFFEVLKDGTLLCRLVNCLQAGSVKRINESKMAFKCMENITSKSLYNLTTTALF